MSELERDLVDLAHDFAEREIRPVARHHDETEEFPWDVVPQGGRDRPHLLRPARDLRRRRARERPGAVPDRGGTLLGRRPDRERDHEQRLLRRTDPADGDRRATRALGPSAHRSRAPAVRARDHRAGGGFGRLGDLDARRTRRGRLPAERTQDLDLGRAARRVVPRVRDGGARHAFEGHHGVRRAAGRRGLRAREADPQAREPVLPGRRALPAGLRRCRSTGGSGRRARGSEGCCGGSSRRG